MRIGLTFLCLLLASSCVRSPDIRFVQFQDSESNLGLFDWSLYIGVTHAKLVHKWVRTGPDTFAGYDKFGRRVTLQHLSGSRHGYYVSKATFWNVNGKMPTALGKYDEITYEQCVAFYAPSGQVNGSVRCYKDDKVLLSANFKHGVLDGSYQTFHKNGSKLGEAVFKATTDKKGRDTYLMLGYSREWDPKGRLILELKTDMDGEPQHMKMYNEGVLSSSSYILGNGEHVSRDYTSAGTLKKYVATMNEVSTIVTFNVDGSVSNCVVSKNETVLYPCKKVPPLKKLQDPPDSL